MVIKDCSDPYVAKLCQGLLFNHAQVRVLCPYFSISKVVTLSYLTHSIDFSIFYNKLAMQGKRATRLVLELASSSLNHSIQTRY
ncbi:unnamed protein product [Coffea canephora]|uniref:Uncharacterized protein n=1 Tax=Coffea canephora TaxID=49390 RepID=A0A068V8E5_COFCA|nr:unnamed protein product [Coffea canephora]